MQIATIDDDDVQSRFKKKEDLEAFSNCRLQTHVVIFQIARCLIEMCCCC